MDRVEIEMTQYTVADPGFPPEGAPTDDFAKCSQKLHEIKRIWAPRGGGGASLRPLGSANGIPIPVPTCIHKGMARSGIDVLSCDVRRSPSRSTV